MTGIKHDAGKLRWDLLPKDIEFEIRRYQEKLTALAPIDVDVFINCECWSVIAAHFLKEELCTWEQIVEVFTKGAEKYGDNNWQQLKDAKNRIYAALKRHFKKGVNEEDFGLPHAAHLVVCCIFLRWFEKHK